MRRPMFLLFIAITTISSCGKEEMDIRPSEAILGKWELVRQGISLDHLSDVTATGYTEYLNDSSYRFLDYETYNYSYGDYALNDSMLIHYYYAANDSEMDTVPMRYFYSFEDHRTLILDIDALAIFDFFVYKKIN